MAGAILKTFGVLLTIAAILALLAGLAAAGFGFLQEQDNQERLLPDPDQTEVNQALVTYGLEGAGAGLIILLLGIILLAAGGARDRAALRREIRQGAAGAGK